MGHRWAGLRHVADPTAPGVAAIPTAGATLTTSSGEPDPAPSDPSQPPGGTLSGISAGKMPSRVRSRGWRRHHLDSVCAAAAMSRAATRLVPEGPAAEAGPGGEDSPGAGARMTAQRRGCFALPAATASR
jgi:hypothetical protein